MAFLSELHVFSTSLSSIVVFREENNETINNISIPMVQDKCKMEITGNAWIRILPFFGPPPRPTIMQFSLNEQRKENYNLREEFVTHTARKSFPSNVTRGSFNFESATTARC